MRKTIGSFLKYYWHAILLNVVFIGIFALFSWLYEMPLGAVGYAALLCLTVGLVAGLMKYRSFDRKLRCLKGMENNVKYHLNDLLKPQNDIEAAYTRLLEILHRERQRQTALAEEQVHSAKAYYTLWVHQIKTPIAAIRLLLQTQDDGGNQELAAELFVIEQYVEMVLSYARLDSSSSDYLIANYDLDQMVRQAVRKYSQLFIRKKIRLDFRESGISVLTDEKWLTFVIEQILANALKYTAKGRITIHTEAESKTLVISDTGIGIAEEDLPRIFEQGFTGYNGRSGKKSTGIGLYLVKRILDKLSHTIAIWSRPGQGTTVRIGLDNLTEEFRYFE